MCSHREAVNTALHTMLAPSGAELSLTTSRHNDLSRAPRLHEHPAATGIPLAGRLAGRMASSPTAVDVNDTLSDSLWAATPAHRARRVSHENPLVLPTAEESASSHFSTFHSASDKAKVGLARCALHNSWRTSLQRSIFCRVGLVTIHVTSALWRLSLSTASSPC